jgi:hypothetical protein
VRFLAPDVAVAHAVGSDDGAWTGVPHHHLIPARTLSKFRVMILPAGTTSRYDLRLVLWRKMLDNTPLFAVWLTCARVGSPLCWCQRGRYPARHTPL